MRPKKFTVRYVNADKDDRREILEIYRQTPELHTNAVFDFFDPEQFDFALTKPSKLFLVAVDHDDSAVKGFVFINIKHQTVATEKARLIHLAVVPEMRKAHLATRLLHECEERLKAMGITNFYSCVNVKNIPMGELLLKNDFKKGELFYRYEKKIESGLPIDFDHDYGESD